ncbi:succinate dehydrogenase cytochrome b subunit [Brumimicrobium oceani]|uniref:Succinate dehydrogenase n=1 Tax=Brumimicrobium oceani TaxID=2100725 RepID=A0A2U2XCX8_9FLAO|nr:succinate dehydrogenase cytochrome b subunit [Brumimicrobium oceani]PWH85561.1 succinate dehydrogenase [Brumimicrobium oceani]
MSKSGLFKSSIGRKFAMALSALFLMIFLLQHLVINITAIISPDTFNELSHFMGTNPLVQFLAQPILIFAVVFHFVMGMYLEVKNKAARPVSYNKFNGGANSSWMSRNMAISGLVILAFLVLHFIDFWFPEINTKYIVGDMSGMHNGEFRYYEELLHKFANPARVIAYIVAFILLALHLMHGFGSAFQSMGQNNKYIDGLKKFGVIYSVAVPLGFIIIAIVLYVTTLN